MLARPSHKKFWSYAKGWANALSSMPFVALTSKGSTADTQTLAALTLPDYDSKRWQQTLMIIAILGIAFLLNVKLGRYLPRLVSVRGRMANFLLRQCSRSLLDEVEL